MEMGTVKEAEHGPGAGMSIGSHSRVRPLKRFESSFSLTQKRDSAKAGDLCGEEEMPSRWRNFLLAGNVAVWLVR